MAGSLAAAAAGLGTLPADAAVRPKRRTSFAVWDPITGASTTAMAPKRVTVHIAAVRTDDLYGPNKGQGDSYAHFFNPRSGQIRQHQYMDRRAAADYNGSGSSISIEHSGVVGDSMTDTQLRNLAKVFAWTTVYCGVPNRIATVGNLNGLAWHRLGVSGNFGTYDPDNRKTWSRAQTGAVWSTVQGKTCPTDKFIDQLPEVFKRAQYWRTKFQEQAA